MVLLNLFHNQGRGRPIGGGGGDTYADKVLGYNPIAYWPLWEPSGGVANDISGNGFHGAYTGVTLGQPGIGDGRTCPLFDGIGDFVDVFSPGFRDAFNGQLVTIALWAKVFNAGVWTDGTTRNVVGFEVDNSNNIVPRKSTTNNRFEFIYEANNVVESVLKNGVSETGWMHLAINASLAADEYKAYYGGSQEGSTQNTLGTWAGLFAATKTTIGSLRTTPLFPWYGWIAHPVVFDGILNDAAIADLAVV